MPTRDELDQSVKISLDINYNFPLDLLVRTPENFAWRLAEGDSFLQEIISRGKACMKKLTAQWLRKVEGDLRIARKLARSQPPANDFVCFCCQQAAEKFLKSMLVELGLGVPPRTTWKI